MSWASLCELSELTEGEGKSVDESGFRLAVFLDGGAVRVIDDECPHARASLGSGYIDRGCAVCPLHGWAFDLRTGALRGSPGMTIRTYPSRLRPLDDGRVLVQVDLPLY